MSTVVAATPASTAAHLPPGPSSSEASSAVAAAAAAATNTSARKSSFTAIAPSPPSAASSSSPTSSAGGNNPRPTAARASASNHAEPSVVELGSRTTSDSGKRSPQSRLRNGPPPVIKVKREPSPEANTPRHRPHRLDLSRSLAHREHGDRPTIPAGARTSLTAKEASLHDLGIACLSPGFHTQDSAMQHQLERSISIRDQQRQLIEARNKGGKGSSNANANSTSSGALQEKVPDTANPFSANKARRKGPPPGLSINAPAHSAFANERVTQSAPLNQTFTGLRQAPGPIQHVPARQTNNRLPPIADVFAGDHLPQPPRTSNPLAPSARSHHNNSPGHSQAPLPSPGFPPASAAGPTATAPPPTSRPREYKSAEEAVHQLAAERGDMLPRIVHYGGHQPPTPPSPLPTSQPHSNPRSAQPIGLNGPPSAHHAPSAQSTGTQRRRMRDEYERDNGSPPLGTGASRYERRPGPFGEGRDSPETQRRKKDEFIGLCARAWDLFHS